MDANDLHAGSRVAGYELEFRLGGGSFGSVWRARETSTGQTVALKVLVGLMSAQSQSALRAEVELLAAAALGRTENVVRVIGGGSDPFPHVVMEYVEGTDLARLLRDRSTLPAREVIRIGLGMAVALDALEQAGIIHRDVKPANVLIDHNGTVKLADFGIAKIVGFETVTATGQLPMTMAYAAPEVWEGKPTHKSDLYAMGVVLYQCLVGSPPFTGTAAALYHSHLNSPPDLDSLPDDTPESLRRLIALCLGKDPAERPANAAECLLMLSEAEEAVVDRYEYYANREPAKFGPWIRRAPHRSQEWAWLCVHEETGEEATVEVHFADNVEYGEILREAVDANSGLVPLGAERLLGTNRLLLRPGEVWTDPPPHEFCFWVARDESVHETSSAAVSIAQLTVLVDQLTALIGKASETGVGLSFSRHRVYLSPETRIHLKRPGLPPASPDLDAEAIAFLTGLPLDNDARQAILGATTLQSLSESLGVGSDSALAGSVDEFGVAHPPTSDDDVGPEYESDLYRSPSEISAEIKEADPGLTFRTPQQELTDGEGTGGEKKAGPLESPATHVTGDRPRFALRTALGKIAPRMHRIRLLAAAGGCLGVLAVVVYVLWPNGESEANPISFVTPDTWLAWHEQQSHDLELELPPEASRIAYFRANPSTGKSDLVVAFSDGTSPSVIAESIDAAPSRIAWSPLGDELAYCGVEDGLYITGADDGEQRTVATKECTDVVWAPNGEMLAIASEGSIWLVNRAGSDLIQLTASDHSDSRPSWSPKLEDNLGGIACFCVAFVRDTGSEQSIMLTQTSKPEEDSLLSIDDIKLVEGIPIDSELHWSPDGGQIAFASAGSIMTVAADFPRDPWTRSNVPIGELSEIYKGPRDTRVVSENGRSPRWSPDGNRLAFLRDSAADAAGHTELFIVAEDGAGERRIDGVSGDILDLGWSPDSRHLFAHLREDSVGAQSKIVAAAADNTAKPLSLMEGDIVQVQWSPRLPVPYTSIRSLLPEGAEVNQFMYLDMDGSETGQIFVDYEERNILCPEDARLSTLRNALIFGHQESGWDVIIDFSEFPTSDEPIMLTVPRELIEDADPSVDVMEQFCTGLLGDTLAINPYVLRMKPHDRDQLVMTVATHTGGNFILSHVYVVDLDDEAKPGLIYEIRDQVGGLTSAIERESFVWRIKYLYPSKHSPSADEVFRISWDETTGTVVTARHLEPTCETGEVDMINFVNSEISIRCEAGSSLVVVNEETFLEGIEELSEFHVGQRIAVRLAEEAEPRVITPGGILVPDPERDLSAVEIALVDDVPSVNSAPPGTPARFSSSAGGLIWESSERATEYVIEARIIGNNDWIRLVAVPCCEWIPFTPGVRWEEAQDKAVALRSYAWNPSGRSSHTNQVSASWGWSAYPCSLLVDEDEHLELIRHSVGCVFRHMPSGEHMAYAVASSLDEYRSNKSTVSRIVNEILEDPCDLTWASVDENQVIRTDLLIDDRDRVTDGCSIDVPPPVSPAPPPTPKPTQATPTPTPTPTPAVIPTPSPSPIDGLYIDMNPESQGIQICRHVAAGTQFEIDIGVSNASNAIGFHFIFLYGLARVTGVDTNRFLSQATGSEIFDASDPLPDEDGEYVVAAVDLGVGTAESGSGVLARLQLTAVTSGIFDIAVVEAALIDTNNDAMAYAGKSATLSVGSGSDPC